MCLKSMFDMSQYWRKLDEEVSAPYFPVFSLTFLNEEVREGERRGA